MPFVALSIPEQDFDMLRTESLNGDHEVIENIGE